MIKQLLPLISKIFEKVLYQQIEDFANKTLSPKLFGFRKGHSTQHALLNLLKNWLKCLEKSGVVGTVLTNLSKAHDFLPHDLLLAKLSTYGRSSQQRCSIKKGILRNFTKFTGKHLCQSFFFNKVAEFLF